MNHHKMSYKLWSTTKCKNRIIISVGKVFLCHKGCTNIDCHTVMMFIHLIHLGGCLVKQCVSCTRSLCSYVATRPITTCYWSTSTFITTLRKTEVTSYILFTVLICCCLFCWLQEVHFNQGWVDRITGVGCCKVQLMCCLFH